MFKGRKIKNLLVKYTEIEAPIDDPKLIPEIERFGESAIRHIIEAFQQRKLAPVKAQFLLEKLCDDSFVETIVSLIGDPYDEVRRFAKEMIIKRYKTSSIPFLIEEVKSADLYSRTNATEILIILKDRSCTTELISAFNNGSPTIKNNIIKILSKTGGEKAKKLLLSALNDESWEVCYRAVKGLGEMKDPESVDPLVEKLQEKDPRMKRSAMDALGAIGDKRAAIPMIELLKDDDLIIRQKATEYLIEIGEADIVQPIVDLMRNEDVNIRRCAVEVLNNLKDPRTSEALMKAIKDSDWWVRQIATDSLTTIKGDNIAKGFIAMTRDPDENLRRCAVEFFNKVPVKSALKELIELLKDPDWWVREKAITALGKLKDERAIAPLTEMIDDEEVKSVIPGALAEIGGAEVLKPLKELLQDELKKVRIETIKALGKLNAVDAVPDLKEHLKDPEEEVRNEAVRVLKKLTGKAHKPKEGQMNGQVPRKGPLRERAGEGAVLTEAILVLDLCNSTDIANRYGDSFALNLMKTLTDMVTPIARREKYQFIKSTGDGFLITFPKADNSVRFAIDVLKTTTEYNSKADKIDKIDLRFAINLGETKVDENGDRLGAAINMAFRVEWVKPEALIPIENGMTKEEIPLQNWIFITENVEREIKHMEGVKIKLVGLFELKGITGLHKVYEIMSQ